MLSLLTIEINFIITEEKIIAHTAIIIIPLVKDILFSLFLNIVLISLPRFYFGHFL